MKKILSNIIKIIIILVVTIAMANVSKADTTTKISLKSDKTTVLKGEEITIDVYVSNIDLEQGIMSVSGKITYNSEALEPITSNDTTYNGWTTSWNTSNGVILMDRGNGTTTEQCIAKLKFKVKETASVNEDTISFSKISIYNSEEEQECANTSCKISLKAENTPSEEDKEPTGEDKKQEEQKEPQGTEQKQQPETQQQQTQKPTEQKASTQQPITTNKGTQTPAKSSTSNEEIPYLGVSEWIVGAIVILIIIGIVAYRGYKKYSNV